MPGRLRVIARNPCPEFQEPRPQRVATEERFEEACAQERAEIIRRRKLYLGSRKRADAKGRIAIVVDDGVATGAQGLHAYFVHSFHFAPADSAHVLARTDYGAPLTAAVARDNLVGVQFHPEKSQRLGLALIANYLRWRP